MLTSNSRILIGAVAYGFGVFAGTAVLGFVVAPYLGSATGLFPIDTEAPRARLAELAATLGDSGDTDPILEGLVEIADEKMADAIRSVSLACDSFPIS